MPLTPDIPIHQRKRLAALKKKVSEEEFSFPVGVPFITEVTLQQVYSTYNMEQNLQDARMMGYRPDPTDHPFLRGTSIAQGYLEMFVGQGEGTVFGNKLRDWVKNHFRGYQNTAQLEQAGMVGAAYVLNAIHTQLGPNVLDRLKHADYSFVTPAMDNVGSTFKPFQERLSVVDRIGSRVTLPIEQVYLRMGLDRLMEFAPCEPCVEDGAYYTFAVLEKMWPHLRPPVK